MKLDVLRKLRKGKIKLDKSKNNKDVICTLTGDKCIHPAPDDMECNRYCSVYELNRLKAYRLSQKKK